MNKTVTIKITREECDALRYINDTNGIEVPDYEGEYQSLVDKGLVIVGGARGPGKCWRRVTLTELGTRACEEFRYIVQVEE